MKKLLFENTQNIENETYSIKSEAKVLNQLNDFWKENRLGKLNYEIVQSFTLNPGKVIYDIIISRIPDVDPNTLLKNNKEKIIEGVTLPRFDPSILHLIELIERKDHLSLFNFDDEVTVNEERLFRYADEKYRYYSDDPNVLELYDELNKLADQLNKLNEKLNIVSLNPITLAAGDYFFSKIAGIYHISEKGIQLTKQGFQKFAAVI